MTFSKLENNNAGFIAGALLCQKLLEDTGRYPCRADDMNPAGGNRSRRPSDPQGRRLPRTWRLEALVLLQYVIHSLTHDQAYSGPNPVRLQFYSGLKNIVNPAVRCTSRSQLPESGLGNYSVSDLLMGKIKTGLSVN